MANRSSKSFILCCAAFLAAVSGFPGLAFGEQLGDRNDPLKLEVVLDDSTEAPKFEIESPETEVTTVGAPGTYSGLVMDFDAGGMTSPTRNLAWDEPLVASAPVRRRQAEPKSRNFDVTPTAGAIATVDSSATTPMPAYSAVPQNIIEEIGKDDEQDSNVLSVNPEPSGKTLLAALLGSLVLIGGFTHVFRPRREEVQPIRFH